MKKAAGKRISLAGGIELDSDKLEQIRTGKNLRRTKSGIQTKNIVITEKDGTKITEKQIKEVIEESTVKRRKKNYVMYESKLGTEKKSEITSVLKPKSKPKPNPRIEEKIIIKKKRKEYLDNYQYHETRYLKKKNPLKVTVEHRRLGDIIGGEFETTTIEKFSQGTYNPKLASNKSTIIDTRTNKHLRSNRSEGKLDRNTSRSASRKPDIKNTSTINTTSTIKQERSYKTVKNPITQTTVTTTIINTKRIDPQLKGNKSEIRSGIAPRIGAKTPATKMNESTTVVNRRNNQTTTNWRPSDRDNKNQKSETITKQIMARRDKNTPKKYDTMTEIKHTYNSRKDNKPQKTEGERVKSSRKDNKPQKTEEERVKSSKKDNKPQKTEEEMAKTYTKKFIVKGGNTIDNESRRKNPDHKNVKKTITVIASVTGNSDDNNDKKSQKGKNTIKKEDIQIVLIKEKVKKQTIEVEEPYKTKTEKIITKTKEDKKRIEDDDHDDSESIHVRRSVRNKYKSKK